MNSFQYSINSSLQFGFIDDTLTSFGIGVDKIIEITVESMFKTEYLKF